MPPDGTDPRDVIRPAHAGKPDPDEPWRYVCPDCGRQLQKNYGAGRYWCEDCGAVLADEMVDLKER